MEGKGCLFKKFAGVDVFDIELAERDPDKLIDIIAAMEPTLGGINLEDIKAPECFYIEQELSKRMNIPVFHDDQHGTAIISSAALLNGLELVGKDIGAVKVAVRRRRGRHCLPGRDGGPGREARERLHGGLQGRDLRRPPRWLDASKQRYARRPKPAPWPTWSTAPTCSWAARPRRADCRHGQDHGRQAHHPGPGQPRAGNPPRTGQGRAPGLHHGHRPLGLPNQVNNVLCFPYIFRGALDCGATKITEAMKLACVREIAALAKQDVSDEVAAAYQGKELTFGPDYLIPTPFDTRLILRIARPWPRPPPNPVWPPAPSRTSPPTAKA
jgi:malate dehydrogenase (oxaloacetate-decarboxylating)(NADP+)